MRLSNYKVVIGFTDKLNDDAHEDNQRDDIVDGERQYLVSKPSSELYAASWQLYDTSFVKKWVTQWERTIQKSHCMLVTSHNNYFDINFPALVDYDETEYFTENDITSVVKDAGELDLICHWYSLYNDDGSDHYPFYFGDVNKVKPYKDLEIRPSLQVQHNHIPVRNYEQGNEIPGYPSWFRSGTLVMGMLMESQSVFRENISRYPYPCRFSIMPVGEGHWINVEEKDEEENA